MEGQLTELNERLEDEEDNNAEITAVKHKLEDEIEDLKQEVSELGTALDKVR
jgi:cell division protein FtsB